jgi:hypothetical protein
MQAPASAVLDGTSNSPMQRLEHPCVLSHPAVSGCLGTVARLLCISSSVSAAVSQHAAGRLQRLELSLFSAVHAAQAKAAWLHKHRELIKGIQSLRYERAWAHCNEECANRALQLSTCC